MRVLVVGANGFIGSTIVAALRRAGVTVRGLVRDPQKLTNRFPEIEAVKLDLRDEKALDPEFWRAALEGVDGVVNAAGVLQPRLEREAWRVHLEVPRALFERCEAEGVKRVVQISAVGIEDSPTAFARSKLAADQDLMARDLDWTILRPAIVVGNGSYGGSSMLRAIAAFPCITPVIRDGQDRLDFIHLDDLAQSIVRLLQSGAAIGKVLEPASHERLTLLDSIRAYRAWLGLGKGPVVPIPNWCVKALARLGDFARLDPITTTAVAQFEARLAGDAQGFEEATGVRPRGLSAVLAERPAGSQDLWHARLYLLRPIIRLGLVVLWATSGLLGLFSDPALYQAMLAPLTENRELATALAIGTSLLDLAIAAALVVGWRLKDLALFQLVVVVGYTLVLTLLAPTLWGDLLGGLLKNLPILLLILVHRILEEER